MTFSRAPIRAMLPIVAGLLFLSPSAHAFKILSPITEGCHERMLLGSLNTEGTGFNGDGQPSTAGLLQLLAARVPVSSIPQDDGTQGLIQEMTNRYGWQSIDMSTRYVLASFIAGVRDPDTDGFSIVDFNVLRETQIRDDQQAAHFLRTKADDGLPGNVAAIQRSVALMTALLNQITNEWNTQPLPIRTARWTFAFYAVNNVTIFSPAYDLGLMVHAIQDSYSHTIRDTSFNILSVANYIELMLQEYDEQRDGPGHSERLDQCNLNDTFDAMRITEIRKQTANVLNAVATVLQANGTDLTAVQNVFNSIFNYADGCDLSNQYCGAPWYQVSTEGVSKPYALGCGSGIISNRKLPPPDSQIWPTLLAILMPVALVIWLRLKRRLPGLRTEVSST